MANFRLKSCIAHIYHIERQLSAYPKIYKVEYA